MESSDAIGTLAQTDWSRVEEGYVDTDYRLNSDVRVTSRLADFSPGRQNYKARLAKFTPPRRPGACNCGVYLH